MATTFYDALNAANLNALRMLDTQLKAQDERNPVPSFLNTVNERIRMQQALNAGKERQDYYNQLKSGLYGKNGSQQSPQYNQGEGIGFNENGQYKIPAQQTFNPYGVDLSGLGGNEGNTISISALNGVQNIQTPKQNSWGSLFNQSFNQPPTDNPQAQAVEGQGTSPNYMSLMSNGQITPQQQQAFDEKMNLRRWIEWDAQNNGVTNPLVALQRYQMFMEPMRQQAELDELRNAYYTFNDPKASDIDKRNAATLIEYVKGNPFMMEDHDMTMDKYNYSMGMIRNPNFNIGNNILSVLGDYEEGEQWMSPDGTGDSRTQCSNWVSDVLRKAGIKGLGSANGDELMKQFGNAYHNGLDGIQPGDVLNFKDHVGIYAGNGQYVARNSSGGVHQGSMEEAIKYFGQPLGYGSVREFSGANTKYIRDPNYVTPREKLNAQQALSDKKFQQQVALAEYKENLRRSRPDNRRSSNNKNKNSSSSLHSALENLAEVSNEFNPEMDMNSKDGQNYKKRYNGAFQDVKNQLNETYPGLGEYIKKQVQQGKSSEDICMEISGAIKQDINTNLPDSKIADVVEELMLDYDNRVKRRQVAPNVAKRMSQKSHTSFTDKQGRGGSIYLGEPEFNRYAGMTDEDIRTQDADRTYDGYARSISSQARLLGNKEFEEGKTKTLRQKHDARVDRDNKRRE